VGAEPELTWEQYLADLPRGRRLLSNRFATEAMMVNEGTERLKRSRQAYGSGEYPFATTNDMGDSRQSDLVNFFLLYDVAPNRLTQVAEYAADYADNLGRAGKQKAAVWWMAFAEELKNHSTDQDLDKLIEDLA
jgi:hypothetical protein